METDPKSQIRLGLGACALALLLILFLAFVPDPLFRSQDFVTRLDDVAGVQRGTEVYFRGAPVGEVTSVELDPGSRNYTVGLSVLKRWRPADCSHLFVSAANPLTAPRIDLVALDDAGPSERECRIARAAEQCDPVPLPASSSELTVTGCKRQPDLIQTAALAVSEAANVARTANQMAQRLQAMMPDAGEGGGSSMPDMAAMARNATDTLAALNSLSVQLDRSFTPGRGDIALTLGNVRTLTGRAAQIDVAAANAILTETGELIAQNQATITELLQSGAGSAAQARATLEGTSASLVEASANLERITTNLGALSERMAADPTFVVRGQRYADPPTNEVPK